MPPTTLTAPSEKNSPAYKVRTMAGDIEALKKGLSPVGIAMALEPIKVTAPASPKLQGGEPAQKLEPTKPIAPETVKIEIKKPAFPDMPPAQAETKQEQSSLPQKIAVPLPIEPVRPTTPPLKLPVLNPPIPKPTIPLPTPLPQKETFNMPVPKIEPQQQSMPPAGGPPATLPTPPRPTAPPPLPPLPPLPPRPVVPTPLRPVTPPPTSRTPPNLPSAQPKPLSMPPPTTAGGVPQLPPLPSLKSSTKSSGNKKLIILGGLAVLVLVFIIGEIWWFFLKPSSTPAAPVNQAELLPPPQELQPLLPPEITTSTTKPSEKNLPEGLLGYSRTETINVDSLTPASIATAIGSFDKTSVGEEEMVRLVVKSSGLTDATGVSDNNSNANNGGTTSSLATMDDLALGLKIKIPTSVKNGLSEDFDLFIFGASPFDEQTCRASKNSAPSCSGPRLGLVLKMIDSKTLTSAVKLWEKTMATDLKPLVLAKISGGASVFQTGMYKGTAIRYKNLPSPAITVEYAMVGDKLIIATSKTSILKAIDSLPAETTVPETPSVIPNE